MINGALTAENEQLRAAAEVAGVGDAEEELAELQEEFAARLAAAEDREAAAKDEVHNLRLELGRQKSGGAGSERKLREATEANAALQAEGEKLARKNGELESALRKARHQIKEQDAECERLGARLRTLEEKAERERGSAESSAEEVARVTRASQLQLSEQRKEFDVALAASRQEAAVAVDALAAAKRELASARAAGDSSDVLRHRADELQEALAQAEQRAAAREDQLVEEVQQLEAECRRHQLAKEETAASSSELTAPLLAELLAARDKAALEQRRAAEVEGALTERLDAADAYAANARDAERAALARAAAAEAAADAAKEALAAASRDADKLRVQLYEERAAGGELRARLAAAAEEAAAAAAAREGALAEAHAALEAEERARRTLTEGNARLEVRAAELEEREREVERLRREAPAAGGAAISVGWLGATPAERRAAAEAPAREEAEPEHEDPDLLDSLLRSAREGTAAHGRPAKNGRLYREGKVAELQRQLAALEAAREREMEAVARAMRRTDAAEQEAAAARETQARFDACLVALGERTERIAHLEEDIAEMKAAFRSQLDAMTAHLHAVEQVPTSEPPTLQASGVTR